MRLPGTLFCIVLLCSFGLLEAHIPVYIPKNGPIGIKLNLVEDGVTIVSINNSIGILKEEYRYTVKGQKKIEVNTMDYESGLYFITVHTPTVIKKDKLLLYK